MEKLFINMTVHYFATLRLGGVMFKGCQDPGRQELGQGKAVFTKSLSSAKPTLSVVFFDGF